MSPKMLAIALWVMTGVTVTLIPILPVLRAFDSLAHVLGGGACTASICWSIRASRFAMRGAPRPDDRQDEDHVLGTEASFLYGRITERLTSTAHEDR